MDRDLVKILSYDVDSFTFEQAVEYACSHSGQIVTINPEMIANAQKSVDFSNVIKNAELVVADGIGVEIGLKILGHNVKRIPGIELGKALLNKFSESGKSVAFIGAKQEVVDKAIENLKVEIPELNVVYSHNGYFSDDNEILSDVEKCHPDLVLVALGSPKQEFFIHSLNQYLPNATMIGLGGSFDVWAGAVKRAPKIWQKFGLEWLYRTIKEPQRFKRIFPTLPLFIIKVLKERVLNK
ncbi:MAG: WecB/TagA/CpsF family glycosyltransferase [Cyanobacteria bacterium SIG26]|nr:WecB/TagA/CpsF family glycosyltransferase [Cyanobacteria bacterium SIG26]